MKLSELIRDAQAALNKYGDMEIVNLNDEWDEVWFLEGTEVNGLIDDETGKEENAYWLLFDEVI